MLALTTLTLNTLDSQPTRLSPLDNSSSECRLVISAGMPRTGSTWMTKMIVHASHNSGYEVRSTYWNYPQHMGWSSDDKRTVKFYEAESKAWEKATTTVFVYKSHEYDPRLLALCSKVAVITSYRCLEDEIVSIVNAGWVPNEPYRIASFIRASLQEFEKWKAHEAFIVFYDTYEGKARSLFPLISSYIGSHLNITTQSTASYNMETEANPAIPSVHLSPSIDFIATRKKLEESTHNGTWCRTNLSSSKQSSRIHHHH